VRDALFLNSIQLSLLMFMVAAGATVASLNIGPWLVNAGCRAAYKIAGLGMAMSAMLILFMPDYWTTLAILLVFGMTAAAIDVAMNAEANSIEAAFNKPIMSTVHGMGSAGGIFGAAAGTMLITAGLAPSIHMIAAALVSFATLLVAQAFILPR
jgi:predicted MFS family arabinose efflux permease